MKPFYFLVALILAPFVLAEQFSDELVLDAGLANRTIYIQNAKAHLIEEPKNYGKLVLIDHILDQWQNSPRDAETRKRLAYEYNNLQQSYEKKLAIAQSSDEYKLPDFAFEGAKAAIETIGEFHRASFTEVRSSPPRF